MTEIYIDVKVSVLREIHRDCWSTSYLKLSILQRLDIQAHSILQSHRAGIDAITFHLGSWCPDFIGMKPSEIMSSDLTLSQCQEAIAREYGYANWNEVKLLKHELLDAEFEEAVDAVITGDIDKLRRCLHNRQGLVTQKSQYGHHSTLLHYIAANGVESYRQITPLNAVEIVHCLVDGGANVNAEANMYGGGSTVLNLVLTSAHPHNAGIITELADALRIAGAA